MRRIARTAALGLPRHCTRRTPATPDNNESVPHSDDETRRGERESEPVTRTG